MRSASDIERVADAVEALSLGEVPDLTPLDAAVGDARVVLLGEQGHGDGAAFAAKARIVEHLHRRHGFGVLAFEADFYALERAWRRVRSASDVDDVEQHVYRFWRSRPTRPLWDLARIPGNPDYLAPEQGAALHEIAEEHRAGNEYVLEHRRFVWQGRRPL